MRVWVFTFSVVRLGGWAAYL